MFKHIVRFCSTLVLAFTIALSSSVVTHASNDGIVRVKSGYPIGETIERLKKDIESKGIMFFSKIDQAQLAADVGITLRPSLLLIFSNLALGTQFITANPNA